MNASQMTPAQRWSQNSQYGKHCPILSSIAPRELAQPGSASAAERNWSIYGQIRAATPANRSIMGHAVADKLVYSLLP